jgi:hypothetical protein
MSIGVTQSPCARLEEEAPFLVAGDVEPAAARALLEHAQACARCAERLREERRLHALMGTWTPEEEPPRVRAVAEAIHADLEAAASWRPMLAALLGVAVAGAAGGGLAASGLRPDFALLAPSTIAVVLAAFTIVLVALLRFASRVLRGADSRLLWTSAILLVLAFSVQAVGVGTSWGLWELGDFVRHGLPCMAAALGVTALGTALFVALGWRARRASTFAQAGAVAGAASAVAGVAAIFLHCGYSDLLHLTVWHGASLLAALGLGYGIARLFARPVLPRAR